MSTDTSPSPASPASLDQAHASLFAELVVQHANMALIFAGSVPHPETGEPAPDLEAAQLFIDRLDMLQAKTRGNLGAQEAALLRQSLATARLAFVEAVERGTETAAPTPPQPATGPAIPAEPAAGPTPPADPPAAPTPKSPAAAEDERRKFVKKY